MFNPVFEDIAALVEAQIGKVAALDPTGLKVLGLVVLSANRIQTIFLVGGLGGNKYLRQFLTKRIGDKIQIKSPHN